MRGDAGAVADVVVNGAPVQRLSGSSFSAWWLAGEPPYVREPFPAWVERHLPVLYLGPKNTEWDALAREYLSEIADRLAPDPAAVELARELTQGLADERARIAVLARYVQRELRYEAIEFGVRARRPNAAARTLELGYGDCKDHALLLVQLLRAAGVESHLALVDSGWSLVPEIPSLDQFDHMVVHVPALGPERLLDPTDKTLDLMPFAADHLWESHALVLDPERPRLVAPPRRAREDYRIESRRTVSVAEDDLVVEETLTLHGYQASWIRAYTEGTTSQTRPRLFQGLLAGDGEARVTSVAFDNADDPSGPAVLELRYRVPYAVTRVGPLRRVRLPALFEHQFLSPPFVAERRTPFEAAEPLELTSTVFLRLPAAPEPSALERRASGANDFCNWTLTAARGADERELRLDFRFEALPGMHPAERYADFHEAYDAALRAWDAPVGWTE